MSSSTRRKLKSAIICVRTLDDTSKESSARTRPLSYDEIMLKRKSKREVEGSGEEAHDADNTRHEETVRNPDRRTRDTNGASMKNSRDSQREASPKRVERSSRTEHTHIKSDSRDYQWEASPKKVEKSSRTEHTHNKSDPQDSQREASPRKKVEKSSRTEHSHIKSDSRDYQRDASPRKKVEKNSRMEHTHIKSDSRDYQWEASSRKKVEKNSRTEHTHIKSDPRDSEREISPRKKVEKSSRTEHTHIKSDPRDSQREISPRKKVEKSSRTEHTHIKSDPRDSQREISPRNKVEKSYRTERTHSKSENKERRDVESRSKPKHDNDESNATESKTDRQGRMRSKTEEHSRGDARYNHENKHHRDSVAQDRYIERNGGASERENKRRDRSGDDEKYRMGDAVKKHDSGSRRNSDISERREIMELSHSRHDETRSKRRRSRSQDRTKDKARRSSSSSPKAQKIVLDNVHDHGELSSHPEKDKSRRHSDVDRSKMSSDGSSSHYRRHGASSSGLGGYSPRKRKSEAAVKTPSPIHSPERKSAGWDLPPSGADKNLNNSVPSGTQLVSQTKPSNMIELAAGFSVASSMGKPISAIFSNSLSAFKQASIDSVQLTQATRPMRRLYIDNIPGSATEKDIMECFNSFLLSSGSNYIRGTCPCISCMIHKEKGQALVEFLTPEDASAALSFDGRSLSGRILKIRRPKDYIEVPSGSSEKSMVGADSIRVKDPVDEVAITAISNFVEDSPHKILVGGIAEGLSSEMIVEIVSAFGTLKAYHFEVNEDLKEPCAFLEYADQSVTLKACAGLNGMRLGGKVLTVAQAVPDTESVESSGIRPFYGIPEHVKPLLEIPTQVLKLSNVLDQKTLDSLSETDLEEIVEDVRLECSRFGSVVSINFVKGGNTHAAISEVKEVTYDVNTIHPPEERNHHLHVNPIEVTADHGDRGGSNVEPPTNVKEFDAMDGVESDKHELLPATTNPELEVGAVGTSIVEESKVADKNSPQNSDEKVDDDPQQVAVIDVSGIDDMARVNDSEGNHQEAPIQESGVSSELNPDENMGIEKSGDGETLHAEDVPELDKNNETIQDAVSLPTNSGATEEGLKNEDSCYRGNIFEVGCVLVEFRRPEASCMAAHCLHGRAFDDRTVTVEYVSLKAYRERFSK